MTVRGTLQLLVCFRSVRSSEGALSVAVGV